MNPARRPVAITGAAQGIGAAIATGFHAAGHPVALLDRDAEAVRARAAALPGALGLVCDMAEPTQIAAALAEAEARLGPVLVLVNNAALTRAAAFQDITPAEWDAVMAVNLRAVLLTCQAVLPGMRAAGWGRIVNMSSIAGQRGGPQVQGAHYATSKAAILGLTRYIAHEQAPHGITVNAIAPGPTHSPATEALPPARLAEVERRIPAGRLGRAEDLASLALWLASDAAGFITGATIDANGGLLMR